MLVGNWRPSLVTRLRLATFDSPRKPSALRAPVVCVQIPLPVVESLLAAREDLFALFVDTGRDVLQAMMEHDRVALCGSKGKRLPERVAVRAGSAPSEVTLGGQRITSVASALGAPTAS